MLKIYENIWEKAEILANAQKVSRKKNKKYRFRYSMEYNQTVYKWWVQKMKESKVRITAIKIENLKNVRQGDIQIPVHDEDSQASITAIFGQNGSGKTTVINALEAIKIENLKNVRQGDIQIPVHDEDSQASITAIFGQNGSGKTTVINALDILKTLISGNPLSESCRYLINMDAGKAKLTFEFTLEDPERRGKARAVYSFGLEILPGIDGESYLAVVDETLKAAVEAPNLSLRMQEILKTGKSSTLSPASKVKVLLNGVDPTDRIVEQKLAEKESRSFLFSPWMHNLFVHYGIAGDSRKASANTDSWMVQLILRLQNYGRRELFVISTRHSSVLSLGYLPLSFRIRNSEGEYFGSSLLKIDDSFSLPKELVEVHKKIIDELNFVLAEIVPGLELSIKVLDTHLDEEGTTIHKAQLVSLKNGKQLPLQYESEGIRKLITVLQLLMVLDTHLDEEGTTIHKAQLVSLKNGKQLPLQYESEGIRKLITVLQLLICVYNQASVTVAIDELDAGIFEYLLGELVTLLQTHGKGQLIFTCHNLRPLETLSKVSNVFTTVNPERRYIRMKNIKEDNNVRKVYYRDIIVQDQEEVLYDSANTASLALAFRKAGKDIE